MSKFTKILLLTLAGIFGIAGIVLVMFFKKSTICGGFAFICLGFGMIAFGIHNKYDYEEKLKDVDTAMAEFVQENREGTGELFDAKIEQKAVKKVYSQFRKNNKTHTALIVAGIVFIFVSFFVF